MNTKCVSKVRPALGSEFATNHIGPSQVPGEKLLLFSEIGTYYLAVIHKINS